MSRYIVTDANWREPGIRPRGWQIVASQIEADSNARLIDKRPEPSFWPTLTDAIDAHPRTWRVSVTLTVIIVLAQIGSMFQ